jgi:LPS-assembly lipoprotein
MKKTAPDSEQRHEPVFPGRSRLAVGLMLLALLATSACGFKLRGQIEIPPELNPLYIQASQGSSLRSLIVQQLQGSQIRLATGAGDARVILRITDEQRSSRVIAVDRGGKALASNLYYNATFDAMTSEGKQLVPRQTIEVMRTYENPDVEVLGKQTEAELIYKDMSIEAATRIMDRLRAALS